MAAASARQKSDVKSRPAPLSDQAREPGSPGSRRRRLSRVLHRLEGLRLRRARRCDASNTNAACAYSALRTHLRDVPRSMMIVLERRRVLDDDLGADRHALVEIDDVGID